jgi:hypothetical protein
MKNSETKVDRRQKISRNDKLDELLDELKKLLSPIQKKINIPAKSNWPIGLIIGCPRSGSTLFLQFLASTKVFSYPTNVLGHFAYAPYIGALIQKLIFDPAYDNHEAFKDIHSELNFESCLGKSKGAMATNEFQHFFRNHMPNFDIQHLSDLELKKVNCTEIMRGLISIQHAFLKPFVTKAGLLQYNIEYFHSQLDNVIWLQVKRDPLMAMQSIFLAREQYHGEKNKWWSVKPKEYEFLKTMDIYHQIAGQVFFTEKAISAGLRTINPSNHASIHYKDLCQKPEQIYEMIRAKFNNLGCPITHKYTGPSHFEYSCHDRLPPSELREFEKAFYSFENLNQCG